MTTGILAWPMWFCFLWPWLYYAWCHFTGCQAYLSIFQSFYDCYKCVSVAVVEDGLSSSSVSLYCFLWLSLWHAIRYDLTSRVTPPTFLTFWLAVPHSKQDTWWIHLTQEAVKGKSFSCIVWRSRNTWCMSKSNVNLPSSFSLARYSWFQNSIL